jgi:drug/metabolite transporter (DMT)-like permease
MTWVTFALLTALTVSIHDAWVKKWFSHFSTYEMFVFPLFYSLPLLSVSLFFIDIPSLDRIFFITFIFSLPLTAIAFFFYIKAIQISPLSLTLPYLAFTPISVVAAAYLFLDEAPDQMGFVGIAVVCAGSYVLNLDMKNGSLLEPFKAVFRETGSMIMLTVSFIFGFSSVLGKLAIMHSSVMFFQMSFFTTLNLMVIVTFLCFQKIKLKTFLQMPVKGCVAGILMFFHMIFHGFAISMTKAAYMMSIKRLSIVLGVILGGVVFHEENFLIRFIGALLMVIGAACILLSAG